MANRLRGEVPVTLGGHEYSLWFPLGAFNWLEREQSIGLEELQAMLALGAIPLDRIPVMLMAGLRWLKEKAPTLEEVAALADETLTGDMQLALIEAVAWGVASDPKSRERVAKILNDLFPSAPAGTGTDTSEPPLSSATANGGTVPAAS